MKSPTATVGRIANHASMTNTNDSGRREFLKTTAKGTLAIGVGLAAIETFAGTPALAADAMDVSKPGMPKPVPTEELFRLGVFGPAALSLMSSKLAVDKATQANAKEFAGFELTEAIAVTTVLKQLNTPEPTPDAKAKQTMQMLTDAAQGPEFDKAYISAQLENHEFLRDHAEAFLKDGAHKGDAATEQTKHIAELALATFKEHVAICTRIKGELGA